MEDLIALHGRPAALRVDNGPELLAQVFVDWCENVPLIRGLNTTKSGAILMLFFDQHEHLGQSIAYARSTGVAPPWSRPMN